MELSPADQQLLASHYKNVASAEAYHSAFGSMMALVTADENLEGAKTGQPDHCLPFMHYHDDPYHAILLHVERSGTSDEPCGLTVSPVGDMHEVAAHRLGHHVGKDGDEMQKLHLQRQAAARVSKVYPNSEAVPSGHCKKVPCHRNERRESSTLGEEIEGAGACSRRGLLCSAIKSITDDEVLIKEKIKAHPEYHKLVAAYINFRKVGAPPDVARRLEELSREYADPQLLVCSESAVAATDPELDCFMENYCLVLHKYEEELSKPFNEAMAFLQRVELQISQANRVELLALQGDRFSKLNMESQQRKLEDHEDEEEGADGFGEVDFEMDASIEPQNEDKQLKEQLFRKYKGYISTLKHEFMKKKKKGKLPKDARQQLVDWWNEHSKWPYPTEAEKATLAETTGLDQKQINNWFINQRKRHWKPSDQDVQYVMVNGEGPPMHRHSPEHHN